MFKSPKRSPKAPKRSPKLMLTISGDILEQVEEFNFLGITVDQNVTWHAHITKMSIKLASVIGILHKLKRTFPQHILRTIYKLYYKLRNNLLPSHFHTFTPYYHNDQHTHDLRYTILRLSMTRREYFAECTKYQFLKLIRCERASLYLYPANLSVHITKCTDREVTILMYCIVSHFVFTHFVEVE